MATKISEMTQEQRDKLILELAEKMRHQFISSDERKRTYKLFEMLSKYQPAKQDDVELNLDFEL
jgi:hypothetical protein